MIALKLHGPGEEGTLDRGSFVYYFDAQGRQLLENFPLNEFTTGYQGPPKVVSLGAAGFVAVWMSSPSAGASPTVGQDGSGSGVFGRRFDLQGNPLGTEFRVNTYT